MKNNDSSALNLLAVILTIGLLVVSWKLISPSYAANTQKLKTLDVEVANAQSKLQSLDKTRSDLSSIDSAYNIISVAVPDGTDEPNLITELEAIAVKNGIALPTISISSDSAGAASVTTGAEASTLPTVGTPISISLSVAGSFDQLNDFITTLEKSVKFFNIQDMNYAFSEEGGLSLSLNIRAYSRTNPETLADGSATQ
jgi:Tfp pilus assembly protein PilO